MTVAGLIAELERLPLHLRGAPVLFASGDVTRFWATASGVTADEDRVIIDTAPFEDDGR